LFIFAKKIRDMAGNIFITSDTHFCHDKEFLFGGRGFSSPEEMNEQIIKNWNELISPNDIVYHLGDVMLSNTEGGLECLKRLNGKIYLAIGNHDTNDRIKRYKECKNIEDIQFAYRLKFNKKNLFLSHYPTLTDNHEEKPIELKVINLHGHTHEKSKFSSSPLCYHVGLDAHKLKPIYLEYAVDDFFNYKNSLKDVFGVFNNLVYTKDGFKQDKENGGKIISNFL